MRPMPSFISEWFRGMEVSVGPDGAIYGLDWSDAGNAMTIPESIEPVAEFINFITRTIRCRI